MCHLSLRLCGCARACTMRYATPCSCRAEGLLADERRAAEARGDDEQPRQLPPVPPAPRRLARRQQVRSPLPRFVGTSASPSRLAISFSLSGVYLRDLVFIEEGVDTRIDRQVNLEKVELMRNLLYELHFFQNKSFSSPFARTVRPSFFCQLRTRHLRVRVGVC